MTFNQATEQATEIVNNMKCDILEKQLFDMYINHKLNDEQVELLKAQMWLRDIEMPKQKKIEFKLLPKEGNYYLVKSQYRYKPHTLYEIFKETDKTIKCREMEYKLIQGGYDDRQGKTNYYYYFKTNVYTKNDMKIKTFNKTKIEKKNIWNWKKLKEEEYYKIVIYEY